MPWACIPLYFPLSFPYSFWYVLFFLFYKSWCYNTTEGSSTEEAHENTCSLLHNYLRTPFGISVSSLTVTGHFLSWWLRRSRGSLKWHLPCCSSRYIQGLFVFFYNVMMLCMCKKRRFCQWPSRWWCDHTAIFQRKYRIHGESQIQKKKKKILKINALLWRDTAKSEYQLGTQCNGKQ